MPVNSDESLREQVNKEIESNDPPIKANQFWVAMSQADPGKIFRKVRILAEYLPEQRDPGQGRVWIFEERAAAFRLEIGRIGRIPEFNLRYVFRLEESSGGT